MPDTQLDTGSRSRKVPIIAGALLLAIVAFLLVQKKLPFGLGGSVQGEKPSVQAQATQGGAEKPSATPAAQPQGGGAKPAAAGAAPGSPGAKPPPVPVKVALVKQAMMTDDLSAVGSLIAEESVVVKPEIAGRVAKIHFGEGQVVKQGAPLISIDPAELSAQLGQTSADVTLSKQRYDRAQSLYRQNFISRQALDEAKSNFERAVAGRQETLAKIAKTEIRAPFTGMLGMRNISVGAYVEPGKDSLVRIEDISSLKLDFRVPELFLGKLREDQDVNVRVDAYPKEAFSGKIYVIEPAVDEKTRTVLLRARVPNSSNKLRPGMFARVDLVLEKRGTALVVPEQAIVPKGNDSLVVKVVDGKAQFTPVKLGRRTPGEVEIVEGLALNDMVVTDGQMKLQPGAQVMVLGAPPGPKQADSNGEHKS